VNIVGAIVIVSAVITAAPTTVAPHETLHSAVTQTLSKLEPLQKSTFTKDIRLTIVTQIHGADQTGSVEEMRRTIVGSVYGALDALGIYPLAPIQVSNDQDETGVDAKARATGADWLLSLTMSPVNDNQSEFVAEIRRIDAGLWRSIPRPSAIYAQARTLYGSSRKRESPAVNFGKLSKLHELAERVVAMSICDVDRTSPGPELITLSNKKIAVFRAESNFLSRLADAELSSLQRSTAISRSPHGHIHCDAAAPSSPARVMIGHSDLAHGISIRISNDANGTIVKASDTQASILVASNRDDKQLRARYETGRPWWNSFEQIPLPKTFKMLAFVRAPLGHAHLGYVLGRDYRLSSIDENFTLKPTKMTSGLGISAYQEKDAQPRFVTTSSVTVRSQDTIRIQTTSGTVLHEFQAPLGIYATAVIPGTASQPVRVLLAGPRANGKRTAIYSLQVNEEE
jgi:hypothetical protein